MHFWGSLSAQEMVHRFWRAVSSGAYGTHGETFLSDDDVLWWACGGKLKGESPKRIAFLREIIESLPGPLEPFQVGFSRIGMLTTEELAQVVRMADNGFAQVFGGSALRMKEQDRWAHVNAEHTYQAHYGEKCYMHFCDRQCYSEMMLELPENKQYRIEIIDAWNMTREVFAEKVSGKTLVKLPGRESMAVLAVRV